MSPHIPIGSSLELLFPPSRPRRRHAALPRCTAEVLEKRVLLANVPEGFTDSILASGLDSPTAMDVAPDGRIFVAGQKGTIYIIDGNQTISALTVPNVNFVEERGLVGIKLDPGFSSNGHVFVYYTRDSGSATNNRIARYTFNGNASVGDETVVLDLPDIGGAIYHMGGALHFAADGTLFVAVGDHLDSQASQRLDSVFGKMLRINPDGSIPTDNPFYGETTGVNRAIWAMGLRNPFTFGVQPGTGRVFINDVGQDSWEEINEGIAGANYGWPTSEGPDRTDGFTAPIHYYGRQDGFAITGGVFYNPTTGNFPSEYVGQYFFADIAFGWIRVLDSGNFNVSEFATSVNGPVDLDVAPDGSLLYLTRGEGITTGEVGRISFAVSGAPTISGQPQNRTVAPGANVAFSVQASGEGTLRYQWQKNSQNIPGANSATLNLQNVSVADAATYRVIVANDIGSVTSNPATLAVVSGSAPTATILTPEPGTTFRAGQTFSFSGVADDKEDGPLGADRFSWRVDYHTGEIVRPFVPETPGITEGTFTIPSETPFKRTDVFYRVHLTVTDSNGLSTTVTRDLEPISSRITLRANIADAYVLLDGSPLNTPTSTFGVAGVKRLLTAEPQLEIGGVTYLFDGWSDGGDREHAISTPLEDATYVARYRVAPNLATKGLAMTVFNNRDRTGTVVTANVPNVDFDWGDGSPDPLIHRDTFFIRFRGKVQPEFTETYTFHARADDGVRLFVNGELLVDQWDDHDGSELSGSINLEAGRKYDLRFDYYENEGDAFAQLLWSSPSTPKQVIPRSKLFSTIMPTTLVPTADTFVQGGAAAGDTFGARGTLVTKTASEPYQRDAYLKFDIRDIDPDAVGSAKLRLFGRLSGDQEINITTALYHAPAAKWGEESITWDNRPATAKKAIGTAVVSNDTNQFWEFELTEFLRTERQAGRTIVTLALRNLDPSQVFSLFYSREAATNLPQLLVWPV